MNNITQHHTLNITMSTQPAALERTLQVIRWRGFSLSEISMKSQSKTNEIQVMIGIKTDKAISLLTNQLNKIYDIKQVDLHSETSHIQHII